MQAAKLFHARAAKSEYPVSVSRITSSRPFETPKRNDARWDYIIPIVMCLLGGLGVYYIQSAQSYTGGLQWKFQIFYLLLGALVYVAVSFINYKYYLSNAHLIYWAGILLLLLLWTPMGELRSGARRWLDFGPLSFQPSESAKICTLLMVSSILTRSRVGSLGASFKTLVKIAATAALPMLLIFCQPDLGASFVFVPMVFALLYVSKLTKRFFITVFGVFACLVAIVAVDIHGYHDFLTKNNLSAMQARGQYEEHSWLPLRDYQRERIITFVAPEAIDPQGIDTSWNQRQSLIAVGSGGFLGKGHASGMQAKLGYLPQKVASTDFIFSVLAEESGFLGGFFVIVLYAVLIGAIFNVARLARDRFGMLLCVGAATILMVHIFVNVGMTIGLMPVKGIPLPFLSYGGSFVLSCCVLLGLVQSVYRFRKDFY